MSYRRKGQSTLEIVVLIVIVAAAVLVMNRFIRRSIIGKLRESADDIGSQFSVTQLKDLNVVTESSANMTVVSLGAGRETKFIHSQKQSQNTEMWLNEVNKEEWFGK